MTIVKVKIPSLSKHVAAMVKGLAFSVPNNGKEKSRAVKGVTNIFLNKHGYLQFDFVQAVDAKRFKELLRSLLPGDTARA